MSKERDLDEEIAFVRLDAIRNRYPDGPDSIPRDSADWQWLLTTQAQIAEQERLANALDRLTDSNHPEYDPEFDREIRSLRPDWFEGRS